MCPCCLSPCSSKNHIASRSPARIFLNFSPSQAHEGKINRTSVLLEGSRHYSNGARVNVDLSSLTSNGASYSLFPGQIVAVEGINSSGRKMVAQRICEGAARPSLRTSVDALMKYHHGPADHAGQDGKALKIMAMSGPYTTSDSLDYAPLLDALTQVQQDRPDVVIMTGPFVDMRQPSISSGSILLEFEDGGKEKGVRTSNGRVKATKVGSRAATSSGAHGKLTYASKRDAYHGYDAGEEHTKTIEKVRAASGEERSESEPRDGDGCGRR